MAEDGGKKLPPCPATPAPGPELVGVLAPLEGRNPYPSLCCLAYSFAMPCAVPTGSKGGDDCACTLLRDDGPGAPLLLVLPADGDIDGEACMLPRIDCLGGERAFPRTAPRSQLPVEDEARASRLSRLGVGMERALDLMGEDLVSMGEDMSKIKPRACVCVAVCRCNERSKVDG